MPAGLPDISVVVPTYGRPENIHALLDALGHQTVPPERFEVVAVDDGTEDPIQRPAREPGFQLELIRQANAGPGAARNTAFSHCRAPLVLILNDDAVPAPDLVERHLSIHAEAPPKTAVMGSFPFTPDALTSPFVQLLATSDLLFDFASLRHGELHDWRYFWTCNISLPLAPILEIGGFDAEGFPEPLMEDVELGYRLSQRGWRVLYREDAVCEHQHQLTSEAYFRRMQRYGVYMVRMWRKHGDPAILSISRDEAVEPTLQRLQLQYEALRPAYERTLDRLDALEATASDGALSADTARSVASVVRRIGMVPMARGVAEELHGRDPEHVAENGAAPGRLTTVIAISSDGLSDTRTCLESLRAADDPDFPTEIVFVDNGSQDGSVEYLRAQQDVTLIENPDNAGAPRARNQALARTRGDWIAVLDNDVTVYPGWLRRLRYHAEIDPSVACVVPVADRAAHGQQIEAPSSSDTAGLERFSAECARSRDRQAIYKNIFSSLCVLMRRKVIEHIGGFDERFSPWGFEDDDFSLRVHLAGYRSRLALDVFVHHAAYTGPKSTRHQQLLKRNWERFAEKWGAERSTTYGEYAFLEPVMARQWPDSKLRVPLSGAGGMP